MKKGLVFLFAALLVVGLPLSALAGTQVYHFKDEPVDFCQAYSVDDTDLRALPRNSGRDVWVCYVGTRHSTVRVKNEQRWHDGRGLELGNYRRRRRSPLARAGIYFASAVTLEPLLFFRRSLHGDILFQGNLQVEEVAPG